MFILCSSDNVPRLNLVKAQSQTLNLTPNPISRVVMFVGICIFEGMAIKTRSLLFKSINTCEKQRSHGISTPKGQRIKKKKKITHTKPIQEATLLYWTNYKEL